MGLGRQAFNIDATWVNALPSWQSMYIDCSQSGPAITNSSTSKLVPRCRLLGSNPIPHHGDQARSPSCTFPLDCLRQPEHEGSDLDGESCFAAKIDCISLLRSESGLPMSQRLGLRTEDALEAVAVLKEDQNPKHATDQPYNAFAPNMAQPRHKTPDRNCQ